MHDGSSSEAGLETPVSKQVALQQGCPKLFLEGHYPAKFSSDPNLNHPNQLIKVFRALEDNL